MGLFGPRHQILELSSIPRERPVLQATINQAKAEARKSRILRWCAILIMIVGLCILVSAFTSRMPKEPKYRIYMPLMAQSIHKGASTEINQSPTPIVTNDSNHRVE